ncbi:MAG: hypothetical protein EA426_16910 [Spirochaetaceae bacterium]|nr:MAG: hypothetical protein EA426_16910 [Spirochaetaceae bacterium]
MRRFFEFFGFDGKPVLGKSAPNDEHQLPLVGTVIETFLDELEPIAERISDHLRYEKDFSGANTMTQGFRDPFSVAMYASELTGICVSYLDSYGETLYTSPDANAETTTTTWVILVEILYPARQSIRTLLREDLRIELAGHVLIGLWATTGENLGRFIRRYYDSVYRTPEQMLYDVTPEELLRLLKTAALVADKVASDVPADSAKAPASPPEESEKQPSPEVQPSEQPSSDYLMFSLIERFGVSGKKDIEAVMQSSVPSVFSITIATAFAIAVLGGAQILSESLGNAGLLFDRETWLLVFRGVGMFAAAYVPFKTYAFAVRRARKKALRAAVRFLTTAKLVSREQAETFLINWYGISAANKILRGN